MICIIEGCDAIATRRNMCNKHYRRTRKHGDPHKTIYAAHGTGARHNSGYWMFEIAGRSVLRHVLIAERALGRRLPKGVEIHHVDGNRGNDNPSNLVICPDKAYHALLHVRTSALNECGNANWRKCHICKKYDKPSRLRFYEPSGLIRHFECWKKQYTERRQA